MERASDTLITESIGAEKQRGKQTVSSFVDGVERRVRTGAEKRQDEEARERVLAEVKNYRAEQLRLFSGSTKVDGIAREGAAGLCNLASKEIVLDTGALDQDKDEGYWKRVEKHEETHRLQAAGADAGGVRLAGKEVDLTALREWDAITGSGQSDAELTADYQNHRRQGEAIAAAVGVGALRDAVRKGTIRALQESIDAREPQREMAA